MNRALRMFSSEVRGLHSAVYVLALFALFSSLLALARDRLLANYFGAGVELDLYYAAFRIPDLIFVALGALVSVYMLIPELSKRDIESQRRYIDTVFSGFSVLAAIVAAIAALFAPALLASLFPHFNGSDNHEMLVSLTRIMLMQPVLLGLSNIFAAITQTRYRYTLYAASPLFYNAGIIVGIVVFYPLMGLTGLAWGVVLGALLHALVQLPSIISDGFFRSFPRIWEPGDLFRTVSISVPRALALSMNQVTFIGLTAYAAALASGSIAVMTFANNLHSVPLAIIGASYSVAAFPTLAIALSRGERTEFIEHIATAARHVLFWSIPITILIFVLRAHIVRTILGTGQFDWTDTRLTAAAFALFSISIVFQSLMLLIVRGFYAAGRTYVPLLFSAAITALTLGLATIFLRALQDQSTLLFVQALLRVDDTPGSHVLALAFAYSIAATAGAIAIVLYFERSFAGFIARIKRTLAESVVAGFGAGLGSYFVLYLIGPLDISPTVLSVFTRGFTAGVFGLIVAASVYHLLRNRELAETVGTIRQRLWKVPVEPKQAIAIVASSEETQPLS